VHISKVELRNYKSFDEPATLIFKPGFNIITGQNNAGKTALLGALNLNFNSNPHKSERTVPVPGTQPYPVSWADVSFTVSAQELKVLLRKLGNTMFCLPVPHLGDSFGESIDFRNNGRADDERLLRKIFSLESLTLRVRYNSEKGWLCPTIPTTGLYQVLTSGPDYNFLNFKIEPDLSVSSPGGGLSGPPESDFGRIVAGQIQTRIYRFSAERFNIGSSRHGNNPVLRPDAQNLPEVLSILQANTHRFTQFNALLKSVLPQIQHVSVRPSPQSGDLVEIIVWTTQKESERIDLALPLSECGTGIGQVMAILYIVLNPEIAETIIIDEPQSFLHPGAARKLIEILKIHAKQQIIIATHSATVISAADPSTVTVVRKSNEESLVEQLDAREVRTLETCLVEIGSRLADVFGADNIMWVEGPTESLCFPLIYNRVAKRALMGTAIVPVRQVGDLEGRDAKRVLEIYRSLSHSASLIPPAVGFIFDRECRTPEQQKELNRLGGGRITFLPRRMYENYLIYSPAIVAVANAIDGFNSTPITEMEVLQLIGRMRAEKSYFCQQELPADPANWMREIDGAKVLKNIFGELSQTRVSYDKVKHSLALTERIIDHAPQELSGLAALLSQILN
jgi:AAA domain, putative AbiEii toxin, Type IV TA system/AAA ATPase domain